MHVEKAYVFESEGGKRTLAELFDGRGQLLVYHFMFPASWEAGCKSCSFWADGYDGIRSHLAARDVTLVAISIAPLAKLLAFRKRMGWSFPWVSSAANDFNRDFGVSFTPDEIASRAPVYNFGTQPFGVEEAPGISVFATGAHGGVFHTYSSLLARARLRSTPPTSCSTSCRRGATRRACAYPMAWVRLHDQY